MKITNIRVSRTFHLGDSNFEKIELSGELEQHDDPMESVDKARNEIEIDHIKTHAELYALRQTVPLVSKKKERDAVLLIPDDSIVAKYNKALIEENEALVSTIESIYSPIHLKKQIL